MSIVREAQQTYIKCTNRKLPLAGINTDHMHLLTPWYEMHPKTPDQSSYYRFFSEQPYEFDCFYPVMK